MHIFLRLYLVVVDEGAVGAVEVHHVQLHPLALAAVRLGEGDQPVLQRRVLLAAAARGGTCWQCYLGEGRRGQCSPGVVQGDVGHLAVPAQQVGGLPVDVEDGKLLTALHVGQCRVKKNR